MLLGRVLADRRRGGVPGCACRAPPAPEQGLRVARAEHVAGLATLAAAPSRSGKLRGAEMRTYSFFNFYTSHIDNDCFRVSFLSSFLETAIGTLRRLRMFGGYGSVRNVEEKYCKPV